MPHAYTEDQQAQRTLTRPLPEGQQAQRTLTRPLPEGVEVDQTRIGTLMFGKPTLRDRDEEEVRGYRDALKLVHESGAKLPISEATIKKLHKLCRGEIWDAGAYKEKDVDIIQTFADGRSRVRFKTVAAKQTPKAMAETVELWQRGVREKWVHPFVLAAALNRVKSVDGKAERRGPDPNVAGSGGFSGCAGDSQRLRHPVDDVLCEA